jgi:hypothetical protein
MKMIGNVGGKRSRAGDDFRFDVPGDDKAGGRAKENQKRRRVFHAPLGAKLIIVDLLVADETVSAARSTGECHVCRPGDDNTVYDFLCGHSENRGSENSSRGGGSDRVWYSHCYQTAIGSAFLREVADQHELVAVNTNRLGRRCVECQTLEIVGENRSDESAEGEY